MSSQSDKDFFYNPIVYHIGLIALFIGGNITLYHFAPYNSWWGLLTLLGVAAIGCVGQGLRENYLRVNSLVPICGSVSSFVCTTLLADAGNLCWILYTIGGVLQTIYILNAVNCRYEFPWFIAVMVLLVGYSIVFTNHEVWYSILAIIIGTIYGLATSIFATIDFVGEYGVKAVKAVVQFVKWIEQEFLTEDVIKDRVSTKCPTAVRAKIMEKKRNAVKLGIFDNSNSVIENVEIECPNGMSDTLRENEEITIRNY